jgi:DNA-directed RNA polymerase specialized sigma24 family protein
VESEAVVADILAAVTRAYDSLPPAEQALIALVYHRGADLRSAAAALGHTEAEAAAAHARAVTAVHTEMLRCAG